MKPILLLDELNIIRKVSKVKSATAYTPNVEVNTYKKFEVTRRILIDMQKEGRLPYYLDRPYFQSRVYQLYNEGAFDQAMALNQLNQWLYPNDPVASIVDFELYQYEGQTLGQIKSIFPIIGKLLKRYFLVITTNKIMNDEYNAFIGK